MLAGNQMGHREIPLSRMGYGRVPWNGGLRDIFWYMISIIVSPAAWIGALIKGVGGGGNELIERLVCQAVDMSSSDLWRLL